jgi:hypothetical protein
VKFVGTLAAVCFGAGSLGVFWTAHLAFDMRDTRAGWILVFIGVYAHACAVAIALRGRAIAKARKRGHSVS